MSDYRKLQVFDKAHELAVDTHHLIVRIHSGTYLPLRNQMLRSSSSIPTNIVEGCDQESPRDFCRFLRYSVNSANELEYQFKYAVAIGVVEPRDAESLTQRVVEVRRMLKGLIKRVKVRAKISPRP